MTENTHSLAIKDELQERAISLGCGTSDRIVGITGQAGTGKTTIMRQIHDAFSSAGHRVAIAAPTGKAAKRISEATGLPAVTLHKLLEYTHPGDPDPKTGKVTGVSVPKRGPDNRLAQSVILVDEYSMINTELDRALMDAIPSGGLVRCFGDINQLPPIEEGGFSRNSKPEPSPFERHLKLFPSVKLVNIYRQGEGSGIVKNAHRILQGFMPQQADDFKMIIGKNPVQSVLDIVMEDDGKKFSQLDYQIIVPMNKGWIGTTALNKKVQELVQGSNMHNAMVMPRSKWDKNDMVLCPGDKIIWMKNDYELEIFNGETGTVVEFQHDQIVIDFGDRTVAVPPWVEYTHADGSIKGYDPRVQLNLAYVVTTHKSQGSEYIEAVYIMDKASWIMQDRSNFYTAVTRGRKHVTVISDQKSIQTAVSTVKHRV